MTKEFKEECRRIVAWGLEKGLITKQVAVNYTPDYIKDLARKEGGLITRKTQ